MQFLELSVFTLSDPISVSDDDRRHPIADTIDNLDTRIAHIQTVSSDSPRASDGAVNVLVSAPISDIGLNNVKDSVSGGSLSKRPDHYNSFKYIFTLDIATLYIVHGSTASLVSTASSLAAGAGSEERQAHEVRKLRRELADAKEKVHTLTTQLTTNDGPSNYLPIENELPDNLLFGFNGYSFSTEGRLAIPRTLRARWRAASSLPYQVTGMCTNDHCYCHGLMPGLECFLTQYQGQTTSILHPETPGGRVGKPGSVYSAFVERGRSRFVPAAIRAELSSDGPD
ncbi:hypothetical protein MSG28_000291 [Choristoneura fumiferana]|uniref:Uncharacterized protein n=1 Tax=Choristoneura fumiferana TaxID=7141 RepID=A0ACC0K0H3_CHOFU|nr:hypothetical protein MSG28_000291 [Choristoneura fumiferana]